MLTYVRNMAKTKASLHRELSDFCAYMNIEHTPLHISKSKFHVPFFFFIFFKFISNGMHVPLQMIVHRTYPTHISLWIYCQMFGSFSSFFVPVLQLHYIHFECFLHSNVPAPDDRNASCCFSKVLHIVTFEKLSKQELHDLWKSNHILQIYCDKWNIFEVNMEKFKNHESMQNMR